MFCQSKGQTYNILSVNIISLQNQPTSKPPRKIALCRYACFGVSRNRLKREVGASGRLLQTARVGRLDAGRYCFACAAFNMAGCSSPVSVTVDPAVTRRVICIYIYILSFFLGGGGEGVMAKTGQIDVIVLSLYNI